MAVESFEDLRFLSEHTTLTKEEWVAMEATAKLSQVFKALGEHHPSDLDDFVFHLHAIQALIMKRPTIRSYPEYFTQMEPTK